MKLIATLISGNSQAIVGKAVDSVAGFVDGICVIDTGISDGTLDVIRSAAGQLPIFVKKCIWRDDFGFVRNEALRFACERGADWAITIDTDERIVLSCEESKQNGIAQLLQQAEGFDVVYALDGTHSYSKERIINCKSDCYWTGVTHETLRSKNKLKISNTNGLVVFELPKSREQLVAKFERDLLLLEQNIEQEPAESRWMFYMASTLESLGEMSKALNWYTKCLDNSTFPGLAAWAAFSGARILNKESQFQSSMSLCVEGLKFVPASPELLWLWALNEYSLDRFCEAATLSLFAISLVDGPSRIDFRHSTICRDLPAWFERPFDLHSWAILKLGDEFGARKFRELSEEKRRIRLALLQQNWNFV